MRKKLTILINLCLRIATLGGKFLLLIFIAHFFNLIDLGIYALFATTISYVLYLLGFDFYIYSTRKMLHGSEKEWLGILKNQFFVYFISYITIFPVVIVVLFNLNFIPHFLIIFFVIITILEHLSQELMRITVVCQKPTLANIQLFLRNGAWCYGFILYSYFCNDKNLEGLFLFWIVGTLSSIILSSLCLKNISIFNVFYFNQIDLAWIFSGIKVAFPFLISTLALRGLFTIDRYILEWNLGVEEVGIYSFYSNLSNVLLSFIDAAVVIHFYPQLVSSFQNKSFEKYKIIADKFKSSLIKISSLLVLGLACLTPILLVFLDNDILINNISVFYTLLISAYIFGLSLIPHYRLYAMSLDFEIIISTIIAFILGIVLMLLLVNWMGIMGVAIGQMLAMLFLFIYKLIVIKIKENRLTNE